MKHTPAVTNCANVSATVDDAAPLAQTHQIERKDHRAQQRQQVAGANREPAQPGPEGHEAGRRSGTGGRDDVARRGRCRISSHETNGTSTQYAEVRNALRPGSIIVRPTVWLIIVPQYVSPVTSPG